MVTKSRVQVWLFHDNHDEIKPCPSARVLEAIEMFGGTIVEVTEGRTFTLQLPDDCDSIEAFNLVDADGEYMLSVE